MRFRLTYYTVVTELAIAITVIVTTLGLTYSSASKKCTYIVLESREERTSEGTMESVKNTYFDVVEAPREYIAGFPCWEEVKENETVCIEASSEEESAPIEETTERVEGHTYIINGYEVPSYITEYLSGELLKRGLYERFINIALAQMYQESVCNPYAENENGLDKGLYQFRITYWDWSCGDIFDYKAQINAYCDNLYRRASEGKDDYTIVSDHYTGEYGYSSKYVSDVYQWLSQISEREETK